MLWDVRPVVIEHDINFLGPPTRRGLTRLRSDNDLLRNSGMSLKLAATSYA